MKNTQIPNLNYEKSPSCVSRYHARPKETIPPPRTIPIGSSTGIIRPAEGRPKEKQREKISPHELFPRAELFPYGPKGRLGGIVWGGGTVEINYYNENASVYIELPKKYANILKEKGY